MNYDPYNVIRYIGSFLSRSTKESDLAKKYGEKEEEKESKSK